MAKRAVMDRAVEVARDILLEKIDPYRGAAAIWARMAEEDEEYPDSLRVFVGLASEWQDHPEHRDALEADIRDEARRIVDSAAASETDP